LFLLANIRGFSVNPLIITILGVVMGLLLVFRTNTAYDRYWEARRLWGTLNTHTRNLSRFFWIAVKEKTPSDRLEKIGAINLLLAFAVSVKRHLRYELGPNHDDIKPLLAHLPDFKDDQAHDELLNLPLEISCHLSSYIQNTRAKDLTDVPTTAAMIAALAGMVDVLSNFERIRDTPIPKAYSIHLKQTLLLYLVSLPFQMVSSMGWATVS
jgi:ion channel-forming bestrophin family protein